ncbi:MAG TPA: hypothetical protein VJM34_13275 [Novosphingobium sp.]|nr:hypothetical protein [Novosphingobium sp.]
MALSPKRIIEPVTIPQHYVPPTGRELRSQSVQRLQVGMFGLCAMLLLVALANVIMDRAKLSEAVDPMEQVIAADDAEKKQATDPLADIGVVPAAAPLPEQSTAPDTAAGSRNRR